MSKLCTAFGLFAGQAFAEDEFICEYLGEVISVEEGNRRGIFDDISETSYLYNLDDNRNIDAKHIGSHMKFVNNASGEMANCEARISFVQGGKRICLHARRNIEVNEELLFDYGYSDDKKADFSWMIAFEAKYQIEP